MYGHRKQLEIMLIEAQRKVLGREPVIPEPYFEPPSSVRREAIKQALMRPEPEPEPAPAKRVNYRDEHDEHCFAFRLHECSEKIRREQEKETKRQEKSWRRMQVLEAERDHAYDSGVEELVDAMYPLEAD